MEENKINSDIYTDKDKCDICCGKEKCNIEEISEVLDKIVDKYRKEERKK